MHSNHILCMYFFIGRIFDNMKNCKKCFLSPDMCGANDDEQKCENIYESRWSMRWDAIKEFSKSAIVIVILLIFLILNFVTIHWQLETGTTLWR